MLDEGEELAEGRARGGGGGRKVGGRRVAGGRWGGWVGGCRVQTRECRQMA